MLRFPIDDLSTAADKVLPVPPRQKPGLKEATSLLVDIRLKISVLYFLSRISPRDFVGILSCGILCRPFAYDPTMSDIHSRFLLLTILLIGITTRSALGFSTTKFVEWYPKFEADLQFSWKTGQCRELYNDFIVRGQGECGHVLSCVLANTTELRKTTIASAQVVLGVTPWLLASIGSSTAEISLLASQKPLLTLFLMLGAPAVLQTRTFEYMHPLKALDALPVSVDAQFEPRGWQGTGLLLLEYILVVAAAVNNVELALEIGSRSVLAWACRSWQMPLFWVLFSASTYFIAFLSIRIRSHCESSPMKVSATISKRREAGNDNLCFSHCRSATVHRSTPHQQQVCTPAIGMLLQIGANCFSFVHGILGTLILAGSIFVGFHDTLGILGRFVASALVCRLIAILELVKIRSSIDRNFPPSGIHQRHTW